MKRLGFLLLPAFTVTLSLAQPLPSTPLAVPFSMGWEESTAMRGGDCTSEDAVINGIVTTAFDTAAGGLEFGQSFTAPCTGRAETFFFVVYNTGTGFPTDFATVNLLLFDGAGTSGTLLASEPYTVSAPSEVDSGEVHQVTFSTPADVMAGQTYTFFIDQLEGNIQLLVSNSGAYPGGVMYFTENGDPAAAGPSLDNWDLTFQVDLLPPNPTASEPAAPGAHAVSAVYPNPLSGTGHVSLLLEAGQNVRVAVFDMLGREVALLHDGPLSAARHGFDLRVNGWPSGVYFVAIRGETFSATRKVVVSR